MAKPRMASKTAPSRLLVGSALIVLVGLGGVLVPQYVSAGEQLRAAAFKTDILRLNDAFTRYRTDHGGQLPGFEDDGFDEERALRQLSLPTAPDGSVTAEGPCGPYLLAGLPPNPWNGFESLKIVTAPELPPADGSSGWVLHVPTGTIRGNQRGH